ncbi:MAG TPA: 50S ribosomal protein L23 [Chloroflexota bacterium]|nr:50S ribosomal protein L23 [Chloroflexota bacterium]
MASDDVWDILRRPLVTEKGTNLSEQGKYLFQVRSDANKLQIKAAVERAWPNVKVVSVNVMNVPGKRRRWKRHYAFQPDWKKAIVTLQPGQRIEFFET